MSVVITVAGPQDEVVRALYEFGTLCDLTDVAVQPEPAGHIRITAIAPRRHPGSASHSGATHLIKPVPPMAPPTE